MDYDLIIVGGGLAGSALAKSMAERGVRVLVCEREQRFRDRIRGESMTPWGVTEAHALGLYDTLRHAGASATRYWATYRGTALLNRRDLIETTTHRVGCLNFYHPAIQEALIRLAVDAGADVRRGVTVTQVSPGKPPTVSVQADGSADTIHARLVVGADGRHSQVRRWGGFRVARDPKRLMIAGVLMTGMPVADDAIHTFRAPTFGHRALLVPLERTQCRVYFMTGRRAEHHRLSGRGQLADLLQYCTDAGVPSEWFAGAEAAGPLASFEGADVWVEHPYQDGVVLVGDAAAANDPCFGMGLALTLRDVRVLRDHLLANDNWDAAAHQYAAAHDQDYGVVHTITSWMHEILHGLGPEADRIRAHALPQLAEGLGPDLLGVGPECAADAATRRRLLGA
jgi:2-polyprenyl-6-methoxyphenol hydroxylase-like FAD-dependent oxidoreductase